MPARLAGGERRRRRSSGSDAEEPVLRGARSARLAVRLAIGVDPHLIEEWTRNQCEDCEWIRARHACSEGARAESLSPTESASMEHKTKSVCESKLQGHRYNGVDALRAEGRERLTFDGAQDKECCQRREAERAQNAKENPERLDFGLSGSVSADSGCSTWWVEPDPA